MLTVPTPDKVADALLTAGCAYMGIARSDALSLTREATTLRQFVAYVMVHRCGIDQDDVARCLRIRQATVSRSVNLVRNYGYDDETRDLAIDLARHLFAAIPRCQST